MFIWKKQAAHNPVTRFLSILDVRWEGLQFGEANHKLIPVYNCV